jgi:hypothetical protein
LKERTREAIKSSLFWPAIREVYAATWTLAHRLGYEKVPPPHAYKQREVKRYAARAKIRTLVETGTYMGHMIDATKRSFDRIYSVELDAALHEAAVHRFARIDNVLLIKGDSGTVVPELLERIHEPALFWLDAHYSGQGTARGEEDCPILNELLPILLAKEHGHIVLIDDSRAFVGKDGYPTLERLEEILSERRPDLLMSTDADLIRIVPRSPR